MLRAFRIFNPLDLPAVESVEFRSYGVEEVRELATHFFSDLPKQEDFATRWQQFKYYIAANIEVPESVKKGCCNPRTETRTTWLLGHLMRNKATFEPFFNHVIHVAEVALIIPVSNAWPERGFSAIKLVKSRLRSSLSVVQLKTASQRSMDVTFVWCTEDQNMNIFYMKVTK